MTINISTQKGKIKLVSSFRMPNTLIKQIEASLKKVVDDVKNVDELLVKLKKDDPLIGTSRGSLLAYMTAQSLTQQKLATLTGISQADISKMINGKRPIGLNVAKKIGNALGVDYRKFL